MVVKSFLPQEASRLSSVLSATFNFENLYKVEQLTRGFDALRQEMEKIGHEAVGVHTERSCDGLRA
jgi:hydrogenase maturation factor